MAENWCSSRKAQRYLDDLRTAYHNSLLRPAIRTATRVLVLVSKAIRAATVAMQRSKHVPDGYIKLSDFIDDVVYLESTDNIAPLPYWIYIGGEQMLAVAVDGKAVKVKRFKQAMQRVTQRFES